MNQTYCFNCKSFVEILDNDKLECEHTKADQQTVYESLVGKADNYLKQLFSDYNIPIAEIERRRIAFRLTIEFLGKWYEDKFIEKYQ